MTRQCSVEHERPSNAVVSLRNYNFSWSKESSKARRLSVVRRTFAVRPPCGSGACAGRVRSDRLAPLALPVGLLLAFLLAAAATERRGNASSGEQAAAGSGAGELENELEDEVDDAPFAIVVEHLDGWRCGGALVSMRTALTSASCARGRQARPSSDLVVRAASGNAPTSAGTRRVSRVAYASDGAEPEGEWHEVGAWLGAALDLALLELESPFESSAHARPILMAATVEECIKAPPCHVVRTPSVAGPLRVALVTPAESAACGAVAHHWTSISDKAMCLTGPELCPNDWGSGVVCAGKLCGVMSRSARAASATTAAHATDNKTAQEDADLQLCGNIHAAQSMARWHDFLHCAHTLQACGKGTCATQCRERQLVEPVKLPGKLPPDLEPEAAVEETIAISESAKEAEKPESSESLHSDEVKSSSEETTTISQEYHSTVRRSIMPPPVGRARVQSSPMRTEFNPSPHPTVSEGGLSRVPFEFEPGRADFKAGEYGDNAADYDEGEESPTRTPSQTPPERTMAAVAAARVDATTLAAKADLDNNDTYFDQNDDVERRSGAASISKPFVTFLMVILFM